jgi:dihydroorotase
MANVSKPLLLQGGRVLDPATQHDAVVDVLIENGLIKAIGPNLSPPDGAQVIRLTSHHWVMPGLVDLHSRFGDPGFGQRETMASGAASALAGGYTTVCVLPDTAPVMDNKSTLQYVLQKATDAPLALHPVVALTKQLAGQEMTEMGILKNLGAVACCDPSRGVASAKTLWLALRYAKMVDMPVMLFPQDATLASAGEVTSGVEATGAGLLAVPSVTESAQLARDLALVRATDARVHFTHITTAQGVAMIRQAKAEGLPVTCQVPAPYLAFTAESVAQLGAQYDPAFKFNPPLGNQLDNAALWAGLADGTIDAIAADHAPWTNEEKGVTFSEAPAGAVGLETTLAAVITHGVASGKLSPLQAVAALSHKPAQALGLAVGILALNQPANLTVVDSEVAWTVDASQFASKSRWTPFKDQPLVGRVCYTLIQGHPAYDASVEAWATAATPISV